MVNAFTYNSFGVVCDGDFQLAGIAREFADFIWTYRGDREAGNFVDIIDLENVTYVLAQESVTVKIYLQ